MMYEEIEKLPFAEKEEQLKNFYIDDIGVLDWLLNDGKPQIIIFNDRIEYKFKNVLHNVKDAAIQLNDGTKFYYIRGIKYSNQEKWNIEATRLLRRKKLKRLLKFEE